MLSLFYAISLLLFGGVSVSSARSVWSASDVKSLDAKLPCSKYLCVTSCGISGLDDLQFQMTGFPFVPESRETTLDLSFVPSKTINSLVITLNASFSVGNSSDITPFTVFRTVNGCEDGSLQLHCPLLAGKRVHMRQKYILNGPYDFLAELVVRVSSVIKFVDQNGQLVCLKGEPL